MSKLKMKFEESFKSLLTRDVNLFLGSGFSMLAKNSQGELLPIGSKLRDEIATIFDKNDKLSLAQLCQIIEKTPKAQELNDYLTKRFYIDKLDEEANIYLNIRNIKIKNIFTTNIDNLPYAIFDNSEYYLNDIIQYGSSMGEKHAIDYYPLHGSIKNPEKGYNFNPISIGIYGSTGYFRDLSVEVRKRPFIFLGYSFSDTNIITALFDSINWLYEHNDKWMLVYDENDNEYFESLGFKIINGSTKDLLNYIGENFKEVENHINKNENKLDKSLKTFTIPSLKEAPSYPLINFFNGQHPQWSHIFSNEIYRTSFFDEMENHINSGKSSLIIGIPVSGKSTLLMMLAAKFQTDKHKLYFNEISKAQAEFVVKKLGKNKAIVFIDKICNDIEAIEFIAKNSNIQLIAAEREYNYQTVTHRLKSIFEDRVCNISELNDVDCKGIFDSIPTSLKKYTSIKMGKENDNFSLYELIALNIRTAEVKSRLENALKELREQDQVLLELFYMICYVNTCRTAVSYTMIYSYLNHHKVHTWEEVYVKIDQMGKLLKDVNYAFEWFENQDYYQPRSEYFSTTVIESIKHGDVIFKKVLETFHEAVSPLNIPNYKTFKRYAFDASLINKAYTQYEDGKSFYDKVFERDQSEYLLQQAALFMKHRKRFKEAFLYIDKALNMAPYSIFSIKNTHAQIMFAANINAECSSEVRKTLDESMKILQECYEKDGRRMVHSLIFGDQAIKYHNKYGDKISEDYIRLAKKWVTEEYEKNIWNRDLKMKKYDLEKVYIS